MLDKAGKWGGCKGGCWGQMGTCTGLWGWLPGSVRDGCSLFHTFRASRWKPSSYFQVPCCSNTLVEPGLK
eukprot:scaffold269386_cov13-Tisochrysis_lutea.AAC.1